MRGALAAQTAELGRLASLASVFICLHARRLNSPIRSFDPFIAL